MAFKNLAIPTPCYGNHTERCVFSESGLRFYRRGTIQLIKKSKARKAFSIEHLEKPYVSPFITSMNLEEILRECSS